MLISTWLLLLQIGHCPFVDAYVECRCIQWVVMPWGMSLSDGWLKKFQSFYSGRPTTLFFFFPYLIFFLWYNCPFFPLVQLSYFPLVQLSSFSFGTIVLLFLWYNRRIFLWDNLNRFMFSFGQLWSLLGSFHDCCLNCCIFCIHKQRRKQIYLLSERLASHGIIRTQLWSHP